MIEAKDEPSAISNARGWWSSIQEMVAAYEAAEDDDEKREEAERAIDESILSVEVRSGWRSLGDKLEPEHYRILLTTGGPALQIVGDLTEYREPETATFQIQDWFQPWCDWSPADFDHEETLLKFARRFYFAE